METDYVAMLLVWLCIVVIVATPWMLLVAYSRRPSRWRHPMVLSVVWMGFIGGLLWLFDDAFAVTVWWPVCVGAVLLAGSFALAVFVRHRMVASLWLGATFAVGVFALHFVDLSPVKPFRRFHNFLQVGMDKAEVFGALKREFPERGRFRVPEVRIDEPDSLCLALDPTKGAYNAEIVTVNWKDGRLASKNYCVD